eukprot:14865551-Alexandrium_andersonii.AAC.1
MNEDWPTPGLLPRALGRDAARAALSAGGEPPPAWTEVGCPVGEWWATVGADRMEFLIPSPPWLR